MGTKKPHQTIGLLLFCSLLVTAVPAAAGPVTLDSVFRSTVVGIDGLPVDDRTSALGGLFDETLTLSGPARPTARQYSDLSITPAGLVATGSGLAQATGDDAFSGMPYALSDWTMVFTPVIDRFYALTGSVTVGVLGSMSYVKLYDVYGFSRSFVNSETFNDSGILAAGRQYTLAAYAYTDWLNNDWEFGGGNNYGTWEFAFNAGPVPDPVPEPSILLLLASGLVGVLGRLLFPQFLVSRQS